MTTTVGQLAQQCGVPKDEVLDACRRAGVLAWSEHTPLDDQETIRVEGALQAMNVPGAALPPPAPPAQLPPPPPGAVPFQGPPPGWAPQQGWMPAPGWTPARPPEWTPLSGGKKGRTIALVVALAVFGIIALVMAAPELAEQQAEQERIRDFNEQLEQLVDDGASSTEATGGELVVGDCWDDLTESSTEEVVDALLREVPCDGPHDAEVYAAIVHPAGPSEPFPGAIAVSDHALFACVAEFERFVGRPLERSSLDALTVFPQEEGWVRLGDREMTCSVVALDGSKLTGTMAGANR